MKFFHSIRWQLQLWHGLLLFLTLSALGILAWELQKFNLQSRTDHELEQRMGIIESAIPALSDDSPSTARGEIRLPPREQSLFDGLPGQKFYFAVWLRDRPSVLTSSLAPPQIPRPDRVPGPPTFRSRNGFREAFHETPLGTCVLIGRNVEEELSALRKTAGILTAIVVSVLALGLTGGWWVSSSAMQPIIDISATAHQIAAGKLDARIPVRNAKSELGELSADLNLAFAQLEASFARLTQFTADASHELRTPLSVISTQIQTALLRVRSPEEYQECLAVCLRAANRMKSSTEFLLMLARLDSQSTRPALQSCDLEKLIHEAVDLLSTPASEKSLRITLDLRATKCSSDPILLSQVLTNILSNAVAYNVPNGSIHITTCDLPDRLQIAVQDTGIGIPADDLPHIFDRFYRVDKSRSSGKDHSGLGLAIAHDITCALDGKISASSTLNKGTTITVELFHSPTRP